MKTNKMLGLVALIAILAMSMLFGGLLLGKQTAYREIAHRAIGERLTIPDSDPSTGQQTVVTTYGGCPTDGDTSLKVDVKNELNDSLETFDTTLYILDDKGSIYASMTDTTAPDAITIDCGNTYTIKIVGADGASGDNSIIQAVYKTGGSDAKVNGDGSVTFTPDSGNVNLGLSVEQHGTLSFKLYDNTDARYAYDSGDADNTVYETTGVIFRDGDNATAFATTTGGHLDFLAKVKGVQTDTDFADDYVLIAVKADVTKWDEPQISWDGRVLSETTLNDDESKALNSYDYVYKITDDIEDKIHNLGIYVDADADPTADVEIDFFAAGNYLSANGASINSASHKDDTSRSAVFTLQGFDIDVS